jgi:hypothetical protein
MRKNLLLLVTIILLGVYSCKNDTAEFPDFDYTTTYFPYQYPVRTLVLGDYIYDNSNDNNLKFKISAHIGGLLDNKKDWTATYQFDPTLVAKLATAPNLFDGKTVNSADTLKILPSEYYTLNPVNQFVVPAGKFIGEIEVQLTEAFLNDPDAVLTRYVLPLRIVTSTTDSVLVGRAAVSFPDPRVAKDWINVPKDYTIFGIKYVNAFHGKYLHRGRSVITDNVPTVLDTIIYRTKYVESNEVWSLQTVGRNKVRVTGTLRKNPSSPGNFAIDLTFDANNDCVVTNVDGSAFQVTGTGKFVKNGDIWGNVPQNAIYLNYVVTEGINKHTITDTLVFRDKAVTFLEYQPVILP